MAARRRSRLVSALKFAAGGACFAMWGLVAACSVQQRGVAGSPGGGSGSAPGLVEATSGGDYQSLEVPGFLPAVLYLPDTNEPRPLVVANHGAGGMPEWECDHWRQLTEGHAVLLCLRGSRTRNDRPSGYYYKTHLALGAELRAALSALKKLHPERIAPDSGVYAGFSQGAIMGAPVVPEYGKEFPTLALIEGGFQYWSPARARRFAETGGRRVLFACGTTWCANGSREPAEWLKASGVEVRIEYAEGAGHTAGGEVMKRTENALPWLLAGDRNWSR